MYFLVGALRIRVQNMWVDGLNVDSLHSALNGRSRSEGCREYTSKNFAYEEHHKIVILQLARYTGIRGSWLRNNIM